MKPASHGSSYSSMSCPVEGKQTCGQNADSVSRMKWLWLGLWTAPQFENFCRKVFQYMSKQKFSNTLWRLAKIPIEMAVTAIVTAVTAIVTTVVTIATAIFSESPSQQLLRPSAFNFEFLISNLQFLINFFYFKL